MKIQSPLSTAAIPDPVHGPDPGTGGGGTGTGGTGTGGGSAPNNIDSVNESNRLAFQDSVKGDLNTWEGRLHTGDSGTVTPQDEAAARKYGTGVVQVAGALADTVELASDAFAGTGLDPATIRARAVRVEVLTAAERDLSDAQKRIKSELATEKGLLGRDLRIGAQIINLAVTSPAPMTAARNKLITASSTYRSLVDKRQAGVNGTRNKTVQLKEAAATAQATATATVVAAQGDVARLKLTNKFLQGDTLRPADFDTAAADAATGTGTTATAGTARPTTASAAAPPARSRRTQGHQRRSKPR